MLQSAIVLACTSVTLLIVLVIATSALANVLRARFPDLWAREGHPKKWLWLQPTSSNNHIFGFLEERRFLASGSPEFNCFCAVIRLGWYLFFLAFAVTVVLLPIALLK